MQTLIRTGPALILLTVVALTACHQLARTLPVATAAEDCPLPVGVSPPARLPVTAQHVEDGNASLRNFVLAAREVISRETTPTEEAHHIACLMRKDGSSYRSGSTYLVILTIDGRVWIHAKDMSLGGRLLRPQIHGAILQAVGVQPADLASPDTALAAIRDAAIGDGGPFDVPDFPGASGYAAVYVASGIPYLLIGGFEVDSEYVVLDEEIDYGDPSVTAEEVVDRETLKAFVTEAGNYFISLMETGGLAAISKARIAGRDPNGPWRHGSVYLYALDTTSNVIVFHGAFPDRYEMRPLVPIARDVVTGKLILPQVIAAAKSSPEGGFVEYYFDDPADDTDRADIPKTGYARVFSFDVPQRPDGLGDDPYEIIVGSGFYGSAP